MFSASFSVARPIFKDPVKIPTGTPPTQNRGLRCARSVSSSDTNSIQKVYPALQSFAFNAVSVKSFIVFLAQKLGKMSNTSEYLKTRHVCLWCAAEILYILDHNGIRLDDHTLGRLQYASTLHILSFGRLYELTHGQYLYHPTPKIHYLEHIVHRAVATRINPLVFSTWEDEKCLARFKALGKRCHGGSMLLRSLQRYILMLSLRWDKRRRAAL